MALAEYQIQDRVGYITLNRPEKRNALNAEMVTALKELLDRAEQDDNCKVVVLKAKGKAFCAGADLAYLQSLQSNTFDENLADSQHLKELFFKIYTHPQPVIAQIQGHAIAGGCGLATVCDFSFSIPDAKFGYTEVKIGFVPAIVKVFLLRKIGEGKSKELLLSGNLISARQAKAFGLINEVVEGNLEDYVKDFARALVENNSGQSMTMTKRMIAEVQELDLRNGLEYAAKKNAEARETEDCKKGIGSFLNKQELKW